MRWENISLWLILLLIFLAEAVFTYYDSSLGLLINFFVILLTVSAAVAARKTHFRMVFGAIPVILFIRVFNASLPLPLLSAMAQTFVIYILVIFIGLLMVRFLSDFTLEDLGLWNVLKARSPFVLVAAVFLGAISGFIEHVINPAPASMVVAFNWNDLLLLSTSMIFLVGFGEELLFRGVLLNSLLKSMGEVASLVYSSIFFAVMHTIWKEHVLVLAFTFVFSMVLGFIFLKTRNLPAITVVHGASNIFWLGVFPHFLPAF